MKITCCFCCTCIIGENPEESAEEERLIENDIEVGQDTDVKQQPAKSAKFKPASLNREVSVVSDEDAKRAGEILKRNKVPLSAQTRSSSAADSVQRATGILKKYKLSSKQDLSIDNQQSPSCVHLKISIKISVRTDSVKIFAIEAANVVSIMKERNKDVDAPAGDDLVLVQIRTKLLPSDVRSHSKKFEVYESLTGAMKFSSECLHTISISEFQSQQIRFRFYNVFKQKRDVLLGEYVLNSAALNLGIENGSTSVILKLYEPNASSVAPPEVCETRRMLSDSSGTGSSGGSQLSTSSSKSYKSTIRRGDVKPITRKGIPFLSQTSESEVAEPARQKPNLPRSLDAVEENLDELEKPPDSPFLKLMKSFGERGDNVEKLESTTEDMAAKAETFSEVSVRLREKYEKKPSKKNT